MSVITPSQFTSKRFGPLEHKRHCHDAVMEYASPTVTAGKTSPGSLDASPSPINERTASLDCASTAGSSDANVNVKSAPKSSGPSDELLLVECPPHKSAEEGERRGKIMTEIINKISNMSQEEQSALQDELERQGYPIYFDFEQEDSNSNDDYWLGMEYKPGIGVVQATL